MTEIKTAEETRLIEDATRTKNWKRWGPYLSERQWGTVREDYSTGGDSWFDLPHDHARSRAYRWGEDGLMGITDRQCRLCFALGLWNEKDPFLKERLFGLTGPQGNHGEDVKELYYYLDSTPTHSYLKALYKYPQAEFPYQKLIEENRKRGFNDPEFELMDTGVFDGNRYFDVFAEYAKLSSNDILIKITVANRGTETARIHVLPQLWFRNNWSWGRTGEGYGEKPYIQKENDLTLVSEHESLGTYRLAIDKSENFKSWLFTDNETNTQRLFGNLNHDRFVKDGFHEYVIGGNRETVNSQNKGTKAAAHCVLEIPAGKEMVIKLRLYAGESLIESPFADFEKGFSDRIREADEYYQAKFSQKLSVEERKVIRQAHAGLLWSKQFYYYDVKAWLEGDPAQPAPPPERNSGRNSDWAHLFNRDIISMPDKWEYPWYAAWDLAFHMIPFAHLDPYFTKEQLVLLLREWYMHPNGQIPAYEFAFDDVNPPVHAWACWRIYKMTGPRGHRDKLFLSRVFKKLLINFTWWVNRKDPEGKNIFSGGFLGLDNIGVFDRSKPLPTGGTLQQADGTAWMAFYCTTMLAMAIELAVEDPSYEDVASKFFEHFMHITDAMNHMGGSGLWDEQDGFYYDWLKIDGHSVPMRVRSMVGIIPLFAVENLEEEVINRLPGFKKRMLWFLENRSDIAVNVTTRQQKNGEVHRLLAIPSSERLIRVLSHLLDEKEFLSDYGIRGLSKLHEANPYKVKFDHQEYSVKYIPGESDSGLFGGNSNWRGPIWLPMNYLIVEALKRFHYFYGEELKVECPTGSGIFMNLSEVGDEIARRLCKIFLPNSEGKRPCHGTDERYIHDPHFKDYALFYEYFHGDSGRGCGASHQTGWTALVAKLMEDLART